ncbi:hypothetical protein AAC03nite_23680 [Alicyclobacillus acidoterrestris]|uniref:glycosyltransferase n=1 Tax=Alicyclobacillus suci TaxID=2816080 RepID=UPI001195FC79|nr:hypothetical protein AAC03nite_23680 [Alicyclobacillus acidoterrestris]
MYEIAYVSTYVPKKCGLATYTHHLRQSVQQAAQNADFRDQVVAVVGADEDRNLYNRSYWLLRRDVLWDYERLAKRINNSSIQLVSLQHEFGIFGGEAGEHVLEFARALQKPLVTTFHTVFEKPMSPYREIQQALIRESAHITVMNRRAVGYLQDAYGVPIEKISYIPHGTPGPSAKPRTFLRQELGWHGRKVILTFGLLGPSKGIESILAALPRVVEEIPNVLYVIAGQTHPEIVKQHGEAYRDKLRKMIDDHQLQNHVIMLDRYMTETDITELITACDLYVTPYPGMEQITSGTLAYAVGAGRPVLSTPYAYARDLLKDLPALLIPYGDTNRWSSEMVRMLTQDAVRSAYEQQIQKIGRSMQWARVGISHWNLFRSLIEEWRAVEGSEMFLATR